MPRYAATMEMKARPKICTLLFDQDWLAITVTPIITDPQAVAIIEPLLPEISKRYHPMPINSHVFFFWDALNPTINNPIYVPNKFGCENGP